MTKRTPTDDVEQDRRLIEDFLPIGAISTESAREKSVRKGHPSTLHLWWARRPLVAARAAVYASLVPASRFVPPNGSEVKAKSLGRANAAKFMERLCTYPGAPAVIAEAEQHILEAHAKRLTEQSGDEISVDDIRSGRAQRPRILDLFAGGGAIPLEALRLGCDAYALDLNPVAHIIQLCTLVYPQAYGAEDPRSRGRWNATKHWMGLADEVQRWGEHVLELARVDLGDLYPMVSENNAGTGRARPQGELWTQETTDPNGGALVPMAYLWTRAVRCKNANCLAQVPLARAGLLAKSPGRVHALKVQLDRTAGRVSYSVHRAATEEGLGFPLREGSTAGAASCPFCPTVADAKYVKEEGQNRRFQYRLMAVACDPSSGTGRVYMTPQPQWESMALAKELESRAAAVAEASGFTLPDEPLEANPRSFDVQHFGFTHWRDVLLPRQLLALTTFAARIRDAHREMTACGYSTEHALALTTCLSMVLGRLANQCTSLCRWQPEFIAGMLGDAGMPMIMDFAEVNPIGRSSGSWLSALGYVRAALAQACTGPRSATVARGSALAAPWPDATFDAVITDPPYYDSRSYSNLSDHFYVWHKRAIGDLFPEHFSSELTPKRAEAIAAPYRHGGSRASADQSYEQMMEQAFREAARLAKPGAPLVCVYAHKTTSGWSTLINALRNAGFQVSEAWPIEMERKVRPNAQDTAALASSILLVGRKRTEMSTGAYERSVRPELEQIVRERVPALWAAGLQAADVVVASVGAGLAAFTRYDRVELANGEEVPPAQFLAEVEGVVLNTLLEGVFGISRSGIEAIDGPSRFYVLWRLTYRAAELEAGEAIVFAYGQPVELDGSSGLAAGSLPMLRKIKGKYHLFDFEERGHDERLGLAQDGGAPSLIDVLHRMLWLLEHAPKQLQGFLGESRPDVERLRILAQALGGPTLRGHSMEHADALTGSTAREQAALGKLLANWRSLVEQQLGEFDTKGQKKIAFEKGGTAP